MTTQQRLFAVLSHGPCTDRMLALALNVTLHKIRNVLTVPMFKGQITTKGKFYVPVN